jgi:hypothetical protein
VKPLVSPSGKKEQDFHYAQATARKDVERAFEILHAQFLIVRGLAMNEQSMADAMWEAAEEEVAHAEQQQQRETTTMTTIGAGLTRRRRWQSKGPSSHFSRC